MARIRSIFPGLFTSDSFMEASPWARLLVLGLWTEAWDDGVFQWKPTSLKARIFPGDNVDVVPLLEELEKLDFFKRFEADGKWFAAIKNFRKYQKPKTPNSSGVLPEYLMKYVCFPQKGEIEVPERDAFPQEEHVISEIGALMEDGGEEIKEKGKKETTAAPPSKSKSSESNVGQILTACLSEQTAKDVIAHRKAKKSPMTEGAARLMVKAFLEFGDAEHAAKTMILRGWTGFNPDWMAREQHKSDLRARGEAW